MSRDTPITSPLAAARYEGWRIAADASGYAASRTLPTGGGARVELAPGDVVTGEGLWGGPLPAAPRTVLTGACVYSDCWRARLAPHRAGARAPRPLALGLRHDRARLLAYLARGRSLRAIDMPERPCSYQRRLVAWQAACVAGWPTVEAVRYHLPVTIYHRFIEHLERALGPQPEMHARLERYAAHLRGWIRARLAPLGVAVDFVDPATAPDGRPLTPAEADRRPYEDAWGDPGVVGLEDLAQLTIAACIAAERGAGPAVRVGVLDLPHPLSTCGGRRCAPRPLTPVPLDGPALASAP